MIWIVMMQQFIQWAWNQIQHYNSTISIHRGHKTIRRGRIRRGSMNYHKLIKHPFAEGQIKRRSLRFRRRDNKINMKRFNSTFTDCPECPQYHALFDEKLIHQVQITFIGVIIILLILMRLPPSLSTLIGFMDCFCIVSVVSTFVISIIAVINEYELSPKHFA